MAEFTRKFLLEHGVPEDQIDAIMAARNQTLNETLAGYVPKSDVQAQIDAAIAKVPTPDPVDPTTTEQYLALADKIKKAIPDIGLTTDIIVGFPGETEEDFEKTLQVMRYAEYMQIFGFIKI